MTLIIGLTGSIGTGKSMISNKLKELQIPVIDADVIAREVVEPAMPAYKEIVATFGEEILHPDRSLNRKALGKLVFSDEKKRSKLNEIIHPRIREEMLRQRDEYVSCNTPCAVMDIPLLFESKLTHYVDKIIVVATDEQTQLERIMTPDQSTIEDAEATVAAQIPIKKKMELADAVIDNNHTKEASYIQLYNILNNWGVDIAH